LFVLILANSQRILCSFLCISILDTLFDVYRLMQTVFPTVRSNMVSLVLLLRERRRHPMSKATK
jgi:hypothetical protein